MHICVCVCEWISCGKIARILSEAALFRVTTTIANTHVLTMAVPLRNDFDKLCHLTSNILSFPKFKHVIFIGYKRHSFIWSPVYDDSVTWQWQWQWQWKNIYCQVTQVHLSVHNKVYTNQITNIQHNLLLQCLITWQRGLEALAYVPQ